METNQKHNVIQWNCRVFRSNFEEIKHLICDFNPSVLASQETHINAQSNIALRGFDHYYKTSVSDVR